MSQSPASQLAATDAAHSRANTFMVWLAQSAAVDRLDGAARAVLRYALVAMLLFFGAFKFTAVEAEGIQPLIANSPFMGWLYSVGSLRSVSNGIGVMEIALALLIAARRVRPSLSAIGSLGAVGMFAITLTFLFSTPGMWMSVPGFPVPVTSGGGAFLVKDVFLLGAALSSAAESLHAVQQRS